MNKWKNIIENYSEQIQNFNALQDESKNNEIEFSPNSPTARKEVVLIPKISDHVKVLEPTSTRKIKCVKCPVFR